MPARARPLEPRLNERRLGPFRTPKTVSGRRPFIFIRQWLTPCIFPRRQPEETTAASTKSSKEWAEPVHPGPLLIGKKRTPAGGFFGDGRPYYVRVPAADPPEVMKEPPPPPLQGPDYPWLTAFQRKELGLAPTEETFKLTARRNGSGGFFTTDVGQIKI